MQCFCGDSNYDMYGTTDKCNKPCVGNGGEFCGGDLALSVYQIAGRLSFVIKCKQIEILSQIHL